MEGKVDPRSLAAALAGGPHYGSRGTGRSARETHFRGRVLGVTLALLAALGALPGLLADDKPLHTSYVWAVETVDRGIDVGVSTSLALDSSGRPHLAYLDPRADEVRYARWTGENWSIEMVDEGHRFVGDVSLALDEEDRPHLSYFWGEIGFVTYGTRNETAWTLHRIDRGQGDGFSSLALDSNGRPLVAYTFLNGRPHLAAWNGSGWNIETVDPRLITARHESLALDSMNRPHIAYYGFGNLYYAVREETGWSVETVDSDGDVGRFASLAIDSQGRPHVAYQDVDAGLLRYAVNSDNRWHQEVVDYQGDTGWDLDLIVGADGRARVVYYERTEADLRYAVRTTQGWVSQVVDSDGVVGWFSSLALAPRGLPHISYYNWSGGTIKYARASLGAVVKTLEPLDVLPTTTTVRGEVLTLGDFTSINVSFQWRPSGAPGWESTAPQSAHTEGIVEASLTNLTPEDAYEYRVRGMAAEKTVYGEVVSFQTLPPLEEDGGFLANVNWALVAAGAVVAVPFALLLIWVLKRRKKRIRA